MPENVKQAAIIKIVGKYLRRAQMTSDSKVKNACTNLGRMKPRA